VNLRRGLLLACAVLLVLSLQLVAAGRLPGWWLLANAGLVGAALLFERRGYRPQAPDPEALRPTGERFHDPTTGTLVEVWEDPHTGAREYRPGVRP
jgi:hypothetical protein